MKNSPLIAAVFALSLFVSVANVAHAAPIVPVGSVGQGGLCYSQDADSGNSDCAGNLACLAGRCSIDNSLDSSGYGKGDGSVQPGGACQTYNDCSGENVCNAGVCGASDGTLSQGEACSSDDECGGELACLPASGGGKACQVDPSLDPSAAAAAAASKTPTGGNVTPQDAFGPIFGFFMELCAWLLGAAGVLLNDAVLYTIVGMGKFVTGLSAIGVTWRILRDIGNIILIFGFLAIGISTIIGYDNYGEKRLPMLLVVALLLNFSLFFSEAIIDVGNIFATQFYTQINGGQGVSAQGVSDINSQGISNAIVQSVALQTLYNVNPSGAGGSGSATSLNNISGAFTAFTNYKILFTAIFAIILFLVAAFVIFSLAFILIFRFVVLIMLIVVAPVGFAGLIVPKLDGLAKDWWQALINNTITAPVLLLMLYIALAVITDVNFLTGFSAANTNLANVATAAADGSAGAVALGNILLSFLVAMGLLMACVMLAKKMSAFGAGAATKWAGAASFGVVGFAGRRSIGRVSNYTAKKIRSNKYIGNTELGRTLAGVADRGAKASFDFRGIEKVSEGLKELKVDAGKAGGKDGYRKIETDAIKERVDYSKSLTQSKDQKQATTDANTAKGVANKEHADTMTVLEEKERQALNAKKAALEPTRTKMNASYAKLEAARSAGNAAGIAAADAAYKSDQKNHEELEKAEQEKVDEVRSEIAGAKTENQKALAAQDKIIAQNSKTANQQAYANNLVAPGATLKQMVGQGAFIGGAHAIPLAMVGYSAAAVGAAGVGIGATGALAYGLGSAGPAAANAASEQILGNTSKDKGQLAIDDIKTDLSKLLDKDKT